MRITRLGDLARVVGVELCGDPDLEIDGVGTLENARRGQISFLSNAKYRRFLSETQASAVILSATDAAHCSTAKLVSDNPYLTYARVASHLLPEVQQMAGCHPSAVVASTADIHPTAWVGACSVIGERVKVDAGVYIGPGSVVENDCRIGKASRLVAKVTLCRETRIGERCLLHPGTVIGADGFGLANDAGRWEKVPQLGRAILGDDVEIGANTTVDRGALEDTVLENGVKLDNLIQVGHNVQIGAHTAMAAACAIAGSTKIGRYCTIGGLTGLAGHLTIGDNVHFSGASQVTRSFPDPGYYSGNLPAMENNDWRKAIARIRQLDGMAKRFKALEKRIADEKVSKKS
ncbi:MAG: UDP-3-O-(3-hydroxymyristoyl)glucosamine N-acyltransferase [Gammaproteobacteria bacterium]|nr:UDP-3-O-(3-hydroxymyristoyl)glucosamine N-acyltransferase [Gammaproteobacteria bacterium]